MAFDPRLRDERVDRLFAAILSLRTPEECYRFFYDLCTVGELQQLAQRFQVAEMLYDGLTYEEIERRTGMSSATISRIKRFLHYGADGYKLAIERLRRGDGAQPPAPGAAPASPEAIAPAAAGAAPPAAGTPARAAEAPPPAGGGSPPPAAGASDPR